MFKPLLRSYDMRMSRTVLQEPLGRQWSNHQYQITICLAIVFLITSQFAFTTEPALTAQPDHLDHLDLVIQFERLTQEMPYGENKKCLVPFTSAYALLRNEYGTTEGDTCSAIKDEVPILTSDHLIRNLIFVAVQDENIINHEINKLDQRCPGIKDKLYKEATTAEGPLIKINYRKENLGNDPKKLAEEVNFLRRIKDKYIIWKAKDPSLQMTLLLPKSYNNTNLTIESAGFNKNAFEKIDYVQFIPTYLNLYNNKEEILILQTPINIAKLKNLFNTSNTLPKRILLMGHGAPGELAQLKEKEYKEFIRLGNDINMQLLYVFSCFSGGSNIKLHETELSAKEKGLDEEIRQGFIPKFMIILSSTNEMMMRALPGKYLPIADFFKTLNNYFSDEKADEQKLAEAMRIFYITSVQGESYESNMASVMYPGGRNFFKVIHLKDGKIKTIKKAKITKHGHRFIYDNKLQHLLLYPAIIDATITINSANVYLYSMLPGDAIHMIDSLRMPTIRLNYFIDKVCIANGAGYVQSIGGMPSPSRSVMFLVKDLKCLNYKLPTGENQWQDSGIPGGDGQQLNIKNFVIFISKKSTAEGGAVVWFFMKGNLYKYDGVIAKEVIQFAKIPSDKTQAEAQNLYTKATNESMPTDKELYYSGETLNKVEPIIKAYLTKRGLYR